VLALAQINKTRSSEAAVRPTLDDLPYDGGQAADGKRSAEQFANAKSAWDALREGVRGVTEFLALKRRFGPTGEPVRLRFNGPHDACGI
jgi:hypothetical protein